MADSLDCAPIPQSGIECLHVYEGGQSVIFLNGMEPTRSCQSVKPTCPSSEIHLNESFSCFHRSVEISDEHPPIT